MFCAVKTLRSKIKTRVNLAYTEKKEVGLAHHLLPARAMPCPDQRGGAVDLDKPPASSSVGAQNVQCRHVQQVHVQVEEVQTNNK